MTDGPPVPPPRTMLYTLLTAILGFYAIAAARFPMLYIWATYEDLIGEWFQVWCLTVAFLVSLRLALSRWRYRRFFVLLAVSCLYVAGEEISWGQRLLQIHSPEFFKVNNLQGETNLHNFFTGPYATPLKAAITWCVAAALGLYGVVYPIMLRRRLSLAVWCEARGIAAPPLYLWPFFATAAVLECEPFGFNEAEIAEIVVGFTLALLAVHYSVVLDCESGGPQHAPSKTANKLTIRLGVATALAITLSAGTTAAVYAAPAQRSRIDSRIANGVEKFAARYVRYEHWPVAAQLYGRLHEAEPWRASVMRKLADCYRQMGNQRRSAALLDEALATDLRRDRKTPGSDAVQRSLARTYRARGDTDNAQRRLERALEIGLKRIKKNPDSAAAAYSLGRTCDQMDRLTEALAQFERACSLKPASQTYRKAYYRAENRMR